MNHSRLAASGLFLFGIVLWLPSIGKTQQAIPLTDAQCRARIEQLFKMVGDPSVDINEVWGDIGDRAGSSFAVYCRIKEANSIGKLKRRIENAEADRKETESSDKRVDKAASAYEPSGIQMRSGPSWF